jgi:hypothetical protein
MGVVHPGDRNPNWRGGQSIASNGYVLVRVGKGHHLADVRGYAYEHRLVAEAKLGRRLKHGEIAHHIDGNRQNNAPSNIEVMPSIHHHRQEHSRRKDTRGPGEANPVIACACGCSGTFAQFDESGRPRRYLTGHNLHSKESSYGFSG